MVLALVDVRRLETMQSDELLKEEYEPRYGKASYPDEESDWNAWKEEELIRDKIEEEKEVIKNESTD